MRKNISSEYQFAKEKKESSDVYKNSFTKCRFTERLQ